MTHPRNARRPIWTGEIGIVTGARDNRPVRTTVGLDSFVALLRSKKDLAEKDGPGFTPFIFRDDRRLNENAMSASVVVFDFDDSPIGGGDFDKAVAALPGVLTVRYRSFSDGREKSAGKGPPKPPRERFRLVVFLKRAVTANEFSRLWDWCYGRFKTTCSALPGTAERDLARLFYTCRNGVEPTLTEGEPLDPDALPDGARLSDLWKALPTAEKARADTKPTKGDAEAATVEPPVFPGSVGQLRAKLARSNAGRTALRLLDSTGKADDYHGPSESDSGCATACIGAGLTEAETRAVFDASPRGRDAVERHGSKRNGNYANYLDRTIQRAAVHVAENGGARPTPPPVESVIGPLGLVLTATAARSVGKAGRYELRFDLRIGEGASVPVALTTSPNGIRVAARDAQRRLGAALGRPLEQAEEIEVGDFFAGLGGRAREFAAVLAAQAPAMASGETVEQIVTREAAAMFGFAFVEPDGRIWSESYGRPVDRNEFCNSVSPKLLDLCRAARDCPDDAKVNSGPIVKVRQYLPVAWGESQRTLPDERSAPLGPDSNAARRLRDAIAGLFNVTAHWKRFSRHDGDTGGTELVTLVGLARERIEQIGANSMTQPSGWRAVHNHSIDAWVCTMPRVGPAGEPTGEPPVTYLALRYELAL
jgi:hypothetical protein